MDETNINCGVAKSDIKQEDGTTQRQSISTATQAGNISSSTSGKVSSWQAINLLFL